jgi:pyruvate dehydrogenase kinase 2/3/4
MGLIPMLIRSQKRICLGSRAGHGLGQCARRALTQMPSDLQTDLDKWCKKTVVPVNLRNLLETGQGETVKVFTKMLKVNDEHLTKDELIHMQVACFLHDQMPIRLANRAKELESLRILRECPHIALVCSWYKQSFNDIRSVAVPKTKDAEQEFMRIMKIIYDRHSHTLITMAKGAHEIRTVMGQDAAGFADQVDLQRILDNFYRSRISVRILIEQYLALKDSPSDESMVGLVSLNASVYDIVQDAINDATYMCSRTHGDAPEVTIHGRTDLTFPYVKSHIHYILLELLKNSMRATVEYHGTDNMPVIRVVIADSETNEDVTIKVSDEGGGIARSNMKRIWSYLFTTAKKEIVEDMLNSDESAQDFNTSAPLAGLGYGLPISRLYARCFGGDLTIMSMEGYGTDCFFYLPRLNEINNNKERED